MLRTTSTPAQFTASHPDYCVWVNASAGCGKTKVLIDRLLRLLLKGIPAHKILCITFTKAASAEMSMRLQEKLSSWAIAPEQELIQDLFSLTGESPADIEIKQARQLFASLLDDYTGVRIQTIHGFCQSILKRFPIEAGLNPHFEVLDDLELEKIFALAIEQLMHQQDLSQGNSILKSAFFNLTSELSEDEFIELIHQMISRRFELGQICQYPLDLDALYQNLKEKLYPQLELDLEFNLSTLSHELSALVQNLKPICPPLVELLMSGSTTEQQLAKRLNHFFFYFEKNIESCLKVNLIITKLQDLFCTQEGEFRKLFFTKGFEKNNPELTSNFLSIALHFESLNQKYKKLILAQNSLDFLILSYEFLQCYEQLKKEKTSLDYNDLILKTCALLQENDLANWVLYKLDGGIDHILIDEAQDTSLEQWDVIKAIVQEFFSGLGAQTQKRTLFVVGDEKQSIYSFQGASPDHFKNIKEHFSKLITESGQVWKEVFLETSYRSTEEILEVVDHLFNHHEHRQGVHFSDLPLKHIAFRQKLPGHVEIWPLSVKAQDTESKEDKENFHIGQEKHKSLGAKQILILEIVHKIEGLLKSTKILPSTQQRVQPKDIMILLRKRSDLFIDLVKELKRRKIPIGGIDRFLLEEETVVLDLITIINWVCLKEDDLSLAILLKSPLIGLSEERLMALCMNRTDDQSLWDLMHMNDAPEDHQIILYLKNLLSLDQTKSLYQFFTCILYHPCPQDKQSGLRAFLSRCGLETEDALLEFLNICLKFDQTSGGGFTAFTSWFERNSFEVKRQLDPSQNTIKILTVHGSKGLQSPIIFLPDTTQIQYNQNKVIWPELSSSDLPLLELRSYFKAKKTQDLKDQRKLKEYEEYKRLLYVALTRAQDELYISGTQNTKAASAQTQDKDTPQNWYQLCWKSLSSPELGCQIIPFQPITQDGHWHHTHMYVNNKGYNLEPKTAEYIWQENSSDHISFDHTNLFTQLKVEQVYLTKKATPSQHANTSEPQSLESDVKRAQGQLIHQFLEYFSSINPAHWYLLFKDLSRQHNIDANHLYPILEKLITSQELAFIFKAPNICEAQIGTQNHTGQIDRILFFEDQQEIWIIDYKWHDPQTEKTNLLLSNYCKQLSSYKYMLNQIYTNYHIRSFILWVAEAQLEEFTHYSI